jgi:hypothetical protein
MAIPSLLELGDILNDPSQNRSVRDLDTTPRLYRHEISTAQPAGDAPAGAKLNDVGVEGAAAINGVASNRLGHSRRSKEGRILRERPADVPELIRG